MLSVKTLGSSHGCRVCGHPGVLQRPLSMAIEFSPTAATNFPTGGHLFSPLVATNLPTNRSTSSWRLVEWLDPLAGGRLRESVAVLPVGDQDVRVMKQPLDGGGCEALGHQLVES